VCVWGRGRGCWLIHGPNQIIFVINRYIFPAFACCAAQCFFFFGSTVPVGLGLQTVEVSRSRSDTPHSVGLLWMNDRSVVETSNWRHTANTTDFHLPGGRRAAADPCLRPRCHRDRHTVYVPWVKTSAHRTDTHPMYLIPISVGNNIIGISGISQTWLWFLSWYKINQGAERFFKLKSRSQRWYNKNKMKPNHKNDKVNNCKTPFLHAYRSFKLQTY
jgi:hypothetical protein